MPRYVIDDLTSISTRKKLARNYRWAEKRITKRIKKQPGCKFFKIKNGELIRIE